MEAKGDVGVSLTDWLQKSREVKYHMELVEEGVHKAVANQLSEWVESRGGGNSGLTGLERVRVLLLVLRNMCSGGERVGEELLKTSALKCTGEVVREMVEGCKGGVREGVVGTLRAAAQFLANLATGSEKGSQAVWEEFYPAGFVELARGCSWEVVGPLCTCILSCVRKSKEVSLELCSVEGGKLVSKLLEAGSRLEGPESEEFGMNEWLLMLVGQLVYVDGLMDVLYGNLHEEGSGAMSVSQPQLQLLQFLAHPDLLEWAPLGEPSWEGAFEAFKSLLGIAKGLARLLAKADRLGEEVPENAGDALEAIFTVLKTLSCLPKDAILENGMDVVTFICKEGLVEWLLSSLRQLGPIRNPRNPTSVSGLQQVKGSDGLQSADLGLSEAERWPSSYPYIGYRTGIVAILSNIVYQRPMVQKMVLDQEGVQLLLNQCQVMLLP